MSTRTRTSRAIGVAVVAALAATTGVMASNNADAAGRCKTKVTALSLDSKTKFAGKGTLRRYTATVDYPNASGWVDQSAKVVYGVFPADVTPAVVNSKIGETKTIGSMAPAQRPDAIAAINGDFYVTPTIRTKTFEIPHGPIVKDSQIIRAEHRQDRAVGLDSTGAPFGGMLGVTGSVKPAHKRAMSVMGVNWEKVGAGGVTVYTPDWSALTNSPRPAGVSEWVLNKKNQITTVRPTGSTTLGAAVAANTRVIAFPAKLAPKGAAGVVGTKVKVALQQVTDTGVTLAQGIGRNLPLVVAGVAAPLGCAAYANEGQKAARPRTILGWTATGAWRTLTVPGTVFTGPGLRNGGLGLANEAAVAKKLGMAYAYELDGGASTTLYTRGNDNVWTRRDLYGITNGNYERPVSDGLAFMAPPPPTP